MDRSPLVCDTSALLYLNRLGLIDLLPIWFDPVYIPRAVVLELDAGRSFYPDIVDPIKLLWGVIIDPLLPEIADLPSNKLGTGEIAVLAFAKGQKGLAVALDDRQARLTANLIGLKVEGTVGLLIRAKQEGLISSLRENLNRLKELGFRLGADVYTEALGLVGEDDLASNKKES